MEDTAKILSTLRILAGNIEITNYESSLQIAPGTEPDRFVELSVPTFRVATQVTIHIYFSGIELGI